MPEFIAVGDRQIAVERRAGRGPGLFWLSGFRSDMSGTKAMTVDAFGASHGLAVTRFDYSGHGQSGGDFAEGTISRWLEETLAVFATTVGPQIVIGSSMGGWLALLLVRALRAAGASRVDGMVLIAPAVDMTELMREKMSKKAIRSLENLGYVDVPSAYSPEPYKIHRPLLTDGRQHLLFGRAIEAGCPVAILQGACDRDVPREYAAKLMQHLLSDRVALAVVPDGTHRMSRPRDLALLENEIMHIIAERPDR